MSMNFCKNFAVLRRAHGYTQEAIAEKCGVSRQAIAKWETGASLPDMYKLSVYYRNEGLAGARALTELDPFRHPQHPDDVCALFLTPENRLERMWVQSELAAHAADGTLLIAGKLLNEPDNIPGLHMGAAVTLTVVETTRGKQCVGVPGMVALD